MRKPRLLVAGVLSMIAGGLVFQSPASADDPDPAITLVEPSTARDFEVVTLEVAGVNPVGATVEFVQGADAYSAEVIDTSGDATSGTIDVLVPEFDWSGIDSSGLTFPMSYEEFVDEINTAGELEFDVEVTNGADTATLVDGFTIQPPAMLINDHLRSGGCGAGEDDTGIFAMSSVMPWGTLAQPAYKSDDGIWYTLTYDDSDSCENLTFGIYGDPDENYSLDFGLGSGVTGSEWHGSTVVDTDDAAEDIVDNGKFRMHLDASGFTVSGAEDGVAKGFGTLISEGTVLGGDPEVALSVSNEYILGEEARFIKITTVISNDQAGELVENVNTWVGTRDDYVGSNDDPKKTRGNIVEGEFVGIENETDPALSILIQEDEEDAAGILFRSTTEGARSIIDDCCDFSNVTELDPDDSPVSIDYEDGSYGMYLPIGDLAVDGSSTIEWYYAAGNIDEIADIVSEVDEAAGGSSGCDSCPDPRGSGSGGSGSETPVTTPETPVTTPVTPPAPDAASGGRELIPGTLQPVAPVPSGGVLPELDRGQSLATVNGEAVPVTVAQTDTAEWTMSGDGFEFSMEVPASDGQAGSASGVVRLTRDREVVVAGEGFKPGSLVDVWLFSTPTFLGTVLVGADGKFTGSLTVPSTIPLGEHTLQANGTSTDGKLRSLNVGVEVLGGRATLPVTGVNDTMAVMAVWLLVAGVLTMAVRRRRFV